MQTPFTRFLRLFVLKRRYFVLKRLKIVLKKLLFFFVCGFFGYLSKKRSLSTSLTPRNIGIYDCYLRHLLSQASAAFGDALASDKVERGDACLRLISVIYMRKFSKSKKEISCTL